MPEICVSAAVANDISVSGDVLLFLSGLPVSVWQARTDLRFHCGRPATDEKLSMDMKVWGGGAGGRVRYTTNSESEFTLICQSPRISGSDHAAQIALPLVAAPDDPAILRISAEVVSG